MITLGEGNTPLLRASRLSESYGIELWLKWEGANPTGSFKDRGMALAVSRAVEAGAAGVVCASTGNTAASAAAYAARAGIEATIVVSAGLASSGKLSQVRAVGGEVLEVHGPFDDAYAAALEIAERRGFVLVNSTNPDRIEGQKTAVPEIVEELGGAPDVLSLPYGGGGNTKAYLLGFLETATSLPRIYPAEAAQRRDTHASAIRIPSPIHRASVEDAIHRSGGRLISLAEDDLARAWQTVALSEGLFCEPAAAAGLAALEHGITQAGERVVCVLTGHGLKDADAVARRSA